MGYYPHPKLKPLAEYDNSVRGRIAVERSVCRRLIRTLKSAGYTLRVHSGDEWETPKAASEDTLMRAMFNLDEAWLIVSENGKRIGYVYLVFGNDGYDVISDHTMNLEAAIAPVDAYANGLAEAA